MILETYRSFYFSKAIKFNLNVNDADREKGKKKWDFPFRRYSGVTPGESIL